MNFNICPINLLRSLSLALELSTGGLSRHHWRTAMIASRLAQHVSSDSWVIQNVTYAALLHDIGAASTWSEGRALRRGNLASFELYPHAELGYDLLKDSPQLNSLADPIRHHHDWWDGSSPGRLAHAKIPLASRVICLADRVETMLDPNTNIFAQKAAILNMVDEQTGKCFDPDLTVALKELGETESFWLDLVNQAYCENFFRNSEVFGRVSFNIDDILAIAQIFSQIIDSMSKFTAHHSRSVARVASFLAEVKGYSADEIKALQIAGLLHDLGKLSVPNEILEKPGALTIEEVNIIRQHPYYTYRILEQIDGLGTIAEWAAYHHETLDGQGYPFHVKGHALRLGSRIVAVADLFVALTEERPYRSSLSSQRVKDILAGMVKNKKIDRNITADLFEDFDRVRSLVLPEA